MKKNKFLVTSLLALGAVCGLASCGDKDKPVSKPEVYFRANSAILTEKGQKESGYKNTECATMTVENADKLKYGKQDVVITIEPQHFFTFRKYDLETWEPIGPAVRPYVGLGNPHSLYNYPLQENVAWTFKDLSEPIDGSKFLKQKYQITVKKDFFKKNIVIDYGNVDTLNNSVYVYNSYRYSAIFQSSETLIGDYKDLYEIDKSVSSFAAASKGATVTYYLKDNSGLYNFNGWAAQPRPQSTSNDDTKLPYEHFEIIGSKKGGSGETIEENIAMFDTSIPKEESQKFIPTVSSDGLSISFYISWDLIANNDADYSMIYDDIKVNLKAPNIDFGKTVELDEGMAQYPCDFYQYTDPNNPEVKKPFDTDGQLVSYDNQGKIELANILAFPGDLKDQNLKIRYAALFAVNDTIDKNKKYFTVDVNGYKFNIDLENGNPEMSTWRTAQSIVGEADLPFWSSSSNYNSWILIQLNPQGRTYGLPARFQNGENLYCLYTTNPSDIVSAKQVTLKVSYAEAPKFVTFNLDESSYDYGHFIGQDDTYTTKVKCVGESSTNIVFVPKDGYQVSDFTIELLEGSDPSTRFGASYVRATTVYGTASINVYPLDPTYKFEESAFTIKLAPTNSVKSLVGTTSNIGWFVDAEGNELPSPCELSEAEIGKTEISFYFQVKPEYYDFVFDAGTATGLDEDFVWRFSRNGTLLATEPPVVDLGNHRISKCLTEQDPISATGERFDCAFYIAKINKVTAPEGFEATVAEKENLPLGNYIDGSAPLNLVVTLDKELGKGIAVGADVTSSYPGLTFLSTASVTGANTIEITASPQCEATGGAIPNGIMIDINISF